MCVCLFQTLYLDEEEPFKMFHSGLLLVFLASIVAVYGGVGVGVEEYHTKYDIAFHIQCSAGSSIGYISSNHDNNKEDRTWKFTCTPHVSISDICWWSGYVNAYDASFNFQCPFNAALTGIDSHHDNNKEDRQFKFKCCAAYRAGMPSECKTTEYLNKFDGSLHYTVSEGRVMTGMKSYHDNHYEDRKFAVKTCYFSQQ